MLSKSHNDEKSSFFIEYEQLSQQEKWQDIINLAIKSLDSEFDTLRIHNIIATCYFYLGKYDKVAQASSFALQSLFYNHAEYIYARCLEGSVALVINDETFAQISINQTTAAIDDESISNYVKAKIYLNMGMFERNFKRDYDKAAQHYNKVIELALKDSDDYNQAVLENITISYDKKHYHIAQALLDEIIIDNNTRIGVHFLLLKSKIHIAQNKYQDAHSISVIAIEIAQNKSMSHECELLTNIIQDIKEHMNLDNSSKSLNLSEELKNKFFAMYNELKKQEKWQEIINLGSILFDDINYTNSLDNAHNMARMYNIIATCHIYLGQYLDAAKLLALSNEKAYSVGDINELVHSCYLLSAVSRVIKEQIPSQKYIDIALGYMDSEQVFEHTKAKVYFNAGALEHDLKNDLDKAAEYYQKAMDIFPTNSDDYNRSVLRDIRILHDKGLFNAAMVKLDKLEIDHNTKTGVHYLMLKSKIYLSQEKYYKTYSCANDALKNAESKYMNKECKSLQNVLKSIEEKCPQIDNFNKHISNNSLSLSI